MAAPLLSRGLAASVAAVAVLNTLSGLSMPVRDRAPATILVVLWLVLLSGHAAAYWFGDAVRRRFGLPAYVIVQAAALFLIAVSGVPAQVAMALFMACTAELVVLAGDRWGTIRITLGAIALFVLASLITSDLYRATTAGLLFALTGALVHAVAALLRRSRPVMEAPPDARPAIAANGESGLSARELEVLQELASGARNSRIAARLGITERTVKAHLGSIYQKLGVESRSAAVAAALQRKLVADSAGRQPRLP
jgi:DNA-binding CsgD family transcriptional regulator